MNSEKYSSKRYLKEIHEEQAAEVNQQNLNEAEKILLSYDYWYGLLVGGSQNLEEKNYAKEVLDCCLNTTKSAYVAVRKSGRLEVVHILQDLNSNRLVFQFAKASCLMKEYLIFLLTKIPELTEASPKKLKDLEELDESGKISGSDGKPWPEDFTSLFLIILLVAKEILAQLDVHPLEPSSSEVCFAYLVQFVEEGVKLLWKEIRAAESQMLEALVTRFAASTPGSPEFSFCCEIIDKTLHLSKRLNCHVDVASAPL